MSIRLNVYVGLVQRLIESQFPQWAEMQIYPVECGGWDNATFRLGSSFLIRIPTAERYASQVKIEQLWLPKLAKNLSLQIPKPVAMGFPSDLYPWHWSVQRWIQGKSVNILKPQEVDQNLIAMALVGFLKELYSIDVVGAPLPGKQNFFRGGDLSVYDFEVRRNIQILKEFVSEEKALTVWKRALSSRWSNSPTWVHGDLSTVNILIENKKLVAVIDFGCMAAGDPACDLVIAWNFFERKARESFISRLGLDIQTWERARGWALWKSLFELCRIENKACLKARKQMKIIESLFV